MAYTFDKETHQTTHNHGKEAKQVLHDMKNDGIPDAYQMPVNQAGEVAEDMQKAGMAYKGEHGAGVQTKPDPTPALGARQIGGPGPAPAA